MGACGSSNTVTDANSSGRKSVIGIETQVKAYNTADRSTFKIVLIGTGECGKSTILKQMKILHMGGFSKEDKIELVEACQINVLNAMQMILQKCRDEGIKLRGKPVDEVSVANSLLVNAHSLGNAGTEIAGLWNGEECLRNEVLPLVTDMPDSGVYFLDRAAEVYAAGYSPSDMDLLKVRRRTTGINETKFVPADGGGRSIRMIDVGGQRGERMKWMKCFDSVDAVMFIASLSEYNQTLEEDSTKNRLTESLDVFKALANTAFFKNSAVFLFLNKDDVFKEKIKEFDIATYFPDYKGGLNYDLGLKFIQGKYYRRRKNKENFYVHVTTATNTKSVEFVWRAACNVIVDLKANSVGVL